MLRPPRCAPTRGLALLPCSLACCPHATFQLLAAPHPRVPARLLACSMEDAKAELLAAVEEAERQGGGGLSSGNEKGWQVGLGAACGCCRCARHADGFGGTRARAAALPGELPRLLRAVLAHGSTPSGTRGAVQPAPICRYACCPPPPPQILTQRLGEIEKKYGLADKSKVGRPARLPALASSCQQPLLPPLRVRRA